MRKFVCKPLPGDASDPQGLTALLDRYLLWMETHHYASGTVKVRRVTLSHFLRWCLERNITRPHEVTPEMLERFQRHVYYYRQRNGQPLSLSSQSHRLTSLRRWFAWLVPSSACSRTTRPATWCCRATSSACRVIRSRSPKWKRCWPRRTSRHPTACGTARSWRCSTRRRCGATKRCRWNTRIWIASAARSWCAVARGRKIASSPSASGRLAWLDKYLAEARPLLARHAETPLVFVSKNGHRLHANQLSKIVRDYLRGAGISQTGRVSFIPAYDSNSHARSRGGRPLHSSAARSLEAQYHRDLRARLHHQAARSARAHASGPSVPPARRATTSGDRPSGPDDEDDEPRVGAGGVSHLAGHQLRSVARPTRLGRATPPGEENLFALRPRHRLQSDAVL